MSDFEKKIVEDGNLAEAACRKLFPEGSASIKKVLPVIIPNLSYAEMNISKGDQASERWEKLISPTTSPEDKEKIRKDLLDYCKLDTWAMVEIYRYLKNL